MHRPVARLAAVTAIGLAASFGAGAEVVKPKADSPRLTERERRRSGTMTPADLVKLSTKRARRRR